MSPEYIRLRKRLREQTKRSRDRDVRIKVELILLALELESVSEACARRGFSRKFYYTWFRRLKKAHWDIRALQEKSRKPKRSPLKTKRSLEKRVFDWHALGYGARMIEALLKREGKELHRSTICHILNHRKKHKKTRRQKLKTHRRRYELMIPGQRLQIDVKYVPEPVSGLRAYNYVAIDECTRYRFAYAYLDIGPQSTVDFLERMKKAMPFPIHTLQTDNGFEFTNRLSPHAAHVEHSMDQWCQKNGIKHRCIPPGEKELNGKVERSHRIDEQYFYWQAPTDFIEHFNDVLDQWLGTYNKVRPHGGLDFKTPHEKLLERWETLRAIPGDDPQYQLHILRFIKELPMRLKEQQLHEKLNHAA